MAQQQQGSAFDACVSRGEARRGKASEQTGDGVIGSQKRQGASSVGTRNDKTEKKQKRSA